MSYNSSTFEISTLERGEGPLYPHQNSGTIQEAGLTSGPVWTSTGSLRLRRDSIRVPSNFQRVAVTVASECTQNAIRDVIRIFSSYNLTLKLKPVRPETLQPLQRVELPKRTQKFAFRYPSICNSSVVLNWSLLHSRFQPYIYFYCVSSSIKFFCFITLSTSLFNLVSRLSISSPNDKISIR